MSDTAGFSKLFTVDEANALLPVLEPKVGELLGTLREIRSEIEAAAGQSGIAADSPKFAAHIQARGVIPALFDRVKKIIGGIQDHGCVVNGPEEGLIDFPCLYKNEIVFLCWKHGEPSVGHWHRIPDGFAGRKPLLDASEPEGGAGVH
jgi:hypothetical protein